MPTFIEHKNETRSSNSNNKDLFFLLSINLPINTKITISQAPEPINTEIKNFHIQKKKYTLVGKKIYFPKAKILPILAFPRTFSGCEIQKQNHRKL